MEGLQGLDHGTYYFFSHRVRPDSWLAEIVQHLRFLGSYWFVTALVLVAVLILLRQARKRAALVVVLFFLIGIGLAEGLSQATERQRPEAARSVISASNMHLGFPSRSVWFSTYAALVLAMALETWTATRIRLIAIYLGAALWIVLACLIPLLLSLHFLTDILAGMAGGGALALLARHFGIRPMEAPPAALRKDSA